MVHGAAQFYRLLSNHCEGSDTHLAFGRMRVVQCLLVTEASLISPAQRLQRVRGGASTLAEQVIARELGERGEGSQALNMMMQGMVSMMSSGRSSNGQRWASR